MRLTIEVPRGGPLFEGHFPGRPILPGVAQLALILAAIGRERGAAALLRAIPFARLRRLVTPGDHLDLAVRDGDDGALRVDLTRGGVPIANAALVLGEPDPPDDWMVAVAARRVTSIPPVEALLPHRGPMRFVETVEGEAEDGLTCTARIPAACALVVDGRAPAVVALEAAAQTAAVWEALRRSRGDSGGPRIGYLVSARDLVLHRVDVPADVSLVASVRLEASAPPLTHYRVEVSWETEPVLRGTMGVWAPPGE